MTAGLTLQKRLTPPSLNGLTLVHALLLWYVYFALQTLAGTTARLTNVHFLLPKSEQYCFGKKCTCSFEENEKHLLLLVTWRTIFI